MSLRTAIRQGRSITLVVFIAAAWTILSGLTVLEITGSSLAVSETVGQTSLAGIVGVLIMAVGLGLLVVLFAEMSHETPTPEPFPPES